MHQFQNTKLFALGHFACFFLSSDDFFFSKSTYFKMSFRNTIKVSTNLDSGQALPFVWLELGPSCLQKLSANDTRR